MKHGASYINPQSSYQHPLSSLGDWINQPLYRGIHIGYVISGLVATTISLDQKAFGISWYWIGIVRFHMIWTPI